MQRNAEFISSKQKTAVLNHINMDGYLEHFERNEFIKLKETVR
jgi:ribosomal protein S8